MADDDAATVSRGGTSAEPLPMPPADQWRDIPLSFWLGPKKLAALTLRLRIEPSFDPFDAPSREHPDVTALPPGVDGVYRPSERLSAAEPVLSVSSTAMRYVERSYRRGFIDLTIDYETYLSKFSGKTRSTLRRKIKKLETISGGKIDWRVYKTRDDMADFHRLARRVSKVTYQEKLFDAGIPEDSGFVQDMFHRADADAVRGFVLFLKETPVSYLYLPIENGRLIYGYLGFDPAHASLSIGTVLQCLALETLFAAGCYTIFDFTEGEGEHKRLFSTDERLCGNVYYLRRTFRNAMIIRAHLALRKLSEAGDRVVARSRLKSRLRRMLRGQSRNTNLG